MKPCTSRLCTTLATSLVLILLPATQAQAAGGANGSVDRARIKSTASKPAAVKPRLPKALAPTSDDSQVWRHHGVG